MKNLICLLALAVLSVLLTGCGTDAPPETTTAVEMPQPSENPEDFSFDWRPYPDGFENGSSTTYNAYVPYDMFGASAGDQIWVYTARFDYESDEGWVVERVNSEKTKDYLITKHEHLTPVVFAWKPANTMLPATGDESHVMLYAALLMLSSVVLVHWVRRRVF